MILNPLESYRPINSNALEKMFVNMCEYVSLCAFMCLVDD